MRYKIFTIVENFFGLQGQEWENGRQRARFFKAVAKPHHFFAPFFLLRSSERMKKEKPRLVGLFFLHFGILSNICKDLFN